MRKIFVFTIIFLSVYASIIPAQGDSDAYDVIETLPTQEIVIAEQTEPEVTESVIVDTTVFDNNYRKPSLFVPAPYYGDIVADGPVFTRKVSLGVFCLTAYCPCSKCCGKYAKDRPIDENGDVIVITASGARAYAGTTVAVDPSVIRFGTTLQINGHTYVAQDSGASIVNNRIDIYFDDHQEAWDFGVQFAEVFICYTDEVK